MTPSPSRKSSSASTSSASINSASTSIAVLQRQVTELQTQNVALQQRVEQSEQQLQQERAACQQQQHRMQQSESKLQRILDSAIATITSFRLFADRTWENEYYSAGCQVMYGFTAQELMADTLLWQSRVVPSDWETILLPLFEDLFQEKIVTAEFRFRHKDDTLIWVSSTYTSRRDDAADCWVITVVDVDITKAKRHEAQRKQAETALQRSEEQLRQIADHIPDVFYLKSLETKELLYINPIYEEIYQQDLEALYRNPDAWTERIHPDDRDRVLAKLAQEQQATEFFEDEYRVLRPDGSIRWIWGSSFAIYNEAGQVYRFAGINRDVTRRKLAEVHLADSEARFRALFEQAAVGMSYTNQAGDFLFANQKFCDLVGYSNAELLTMTYMDVTHPEDLDGDMAQTDRLIAGEIEQFSIEKRFVRQDGSLIWVALTLCMVRNGEGEGRSHLAISQDITPQRQVEAERQVAQIALAESEARFRKLFEQIPVGVSYTNPDGQYLMVNPKFCQILGYAEVELLTKTFMEVTHPEDLAADLMQDSQLLTGEIDQFAMEKRFICKDGSIVWTELLISAMTNRHGVPKYSLGVTQDITERKRLEADRAAIEAKLRRYQRIVKSTADSIYLIDRSYIFQVANPAYLTLTGHQAEELVGHAISNVLGNEVFQTTIQSRLERAFNGETVAYESWFLYAHTGRRFLSVTYVPYREADGTISHVVASLRDITSLKQAEDALRLSEEQRHLALDLTHIGSWDWYPSTGQIIWNDNHYRLLGLPVGNSRVTYRDWRDRVHPDDLERIEQAVLDALDNQTNYEGEYRVIHPNGSIRWLLGKGRGIYDHRGLPMRMVGIVIDITDRKQVETVLRMQSWRSQIFADLTLKIRQSLDLEDTLKTTVTEVQQLLQVDRVLLYQLDPRGSGKVVKEALTPHRRRAALLGLDILDPCFQDSYIDKYRQGRVRAIGDIYNSDIQPCHRDFLSQFGVRANLVVPILLGGVDPDASPAAKQKSVLWGLLIAHHCQEPRHWSEFEIDLLQQMGTQIGIVICRSNLLQALKASEAKFSGILEMASDAIISIDQNRQITLFNQGAERQFGYTSEEILGQSPALLLPDRLQSVYHHYAKTIVSDFAPAARLNQTREVIVRRKDGSEFPVEAAISKLELPSETLYTVILRDITERKQAEAKLRQWAQQEQALNRLIQIVRSSLDLDTVFAAAVIEMGQLLQVNRVAIAQYFPQENLWRHGAEYFQAPDTAFYADLEVPDHNNPIAQILKQGKVVRINDSAILEDAIHQPIAEQIPGACLLVPLAVNQVIWGCIILKKSRPFHWQDEQVELVQAIANQLGIAIQQAGLYQQAQQELAERRRAEADLQDRETRLRAIGNNLPQGAIFQLVHDPAQGFHFSYYSAGIEQIIGIQPAAILQDADVLFDLLTEEERDRHDYLLHQSLLHLTLFEMEMCQRHVLTGEIQWAFVRATPRRLKDGRTIWDGIEVDITALKQAEAQLHQWNQELEQRVQKRTSQLQAAMTAACMGSWDWELETNEETWSPQLCHLLGLRTNELGQPLDSQDRLLIPTYELFLQFVHPDDIAYIWRRQQQAQAQQTIYDSEYRVLRLDGSQRWFYSRGDYQYDDQGTPIRLSGITMDITERKQAEDALRQSEERFRSVFDHAPIGMAVADVKDYRFITVNPAFCQLLGYSEAELLAISCSLVSHPDDFDAERPYSIAMIAGEIDSYQMEKRYVKQDGSILLGYLTAKAMRSESGNTLHILGMVQDISERKQAENQIRASLAEKEVLLKEIHHRVKNNLQVISSLLSMQARTLQDPALREPLLESQRRVRVMAIIHEHLYQTSDLAQIDFADHIRNLVSNLLRSYVPEGAAIAIHMELDCAQMGVDAVIPCGLIINELVSNAIKYAFPDHQAGEITVAFHSNAFNHHSLIVRDNGIGFPEELDFRTSKSLGLKIVTALTKQLGGSIELERQHGTSFMIRFTT